MATSEENPPEHRPEAEEVLDPEPGSLERPPASPAAQRSGLEDAADGIIEMGVRVATPLVRFGWRAVRGVGKRLGVNPAVERQVGKALDSEAAARTTERVLETPAANQVWDTVLESDQAQKLVERVAEAPEVRSAITSQGVGLLEDLRRVVRGLARRLDTGVERVAKRLLRRQVRESRPLQAGAVTRSAALLLDCAIVYGALLLLSAAVALLITVLNPGEEQVGKFAVAIGGTAWLIAGAIYLAFFWSAAGRTPGMAFLAIRLTVFGHERIAPGRAIRRVIWLNLSMLALMLGFWGVLFEQRRRGWPDRRTGTQVLYADPELDGELPGWAPPPERL